MKHTFLICVILGIALYFLFVRQREGYRDPIMVPREKLALDWYPRANGSIYGPCSHTYSGWAYYPTAI